MLYATNIRARCPECGKLHDYKGPNAEGVSIETAQEWCNNNGFPYAKVIGVLIAEVDDDDNIIVDYETHILN